MWKGKGGAMGVQQPMFMKAAPVAGDARFKTTMCKFFMEGACQKGDECTFSHGEEPGAAAPAAVGQTPCRFFSQGLCTKGDMCTFSHENGGGGGGGWKGGGMAKGGFAKGGGDWGGGMMMKGAPMAYGGKGGGGFATPSYGGKGGGDWGGGKGGQTPCMFFAKGQCTKGAQCTFSHGGGGGKGFAFGGKDGGKGKGKDGKSKNKSPGHLLPRTRISEAPFSGTVVEWKGKYGWIEPAETIEHEKASKHGGRLFFSMDAVTSGEAPEAGTTVEFHIFEDVSGIGAEEVTAF